MCRGMVLLMPCERALRMGSWSLSPGLCWHRAGCPRRAGQEACTLSSLTPTPDTSELCGVHVSFCLDALLFARSPEPPISPLRPCPKVTSAFLITKSYGPDRVCFPLCMFRSVPTCAIVFHYGRKITSELGKKKIVFIYLAVPGLSCGTWYL